MLIGAPYSVVKIIVFANDSESFICVVVMESVYRQVSMTLTIETSGDHLVTLVKVTLSYCEAPILNINVLVAVVGSCFYSRFC